MNPLPHIRPYLTEWIPYSKRILPEPNCLREVLPDCSLLNSQESYFSYCEGGQGILRYGVHLLMKRCRRVSILTEFKGKSTELRIWLVAEGDNPTEEILRRTLDEIVSLVAMEEP